MTRPQTPRILWSFAALGAAAAIFVFDLMVPLGVAEGVLYVAVMLLVRQIDSTRHVIIWAFVLSALTVAGYFFSLEGGIGWMVMANRGLTLFAIWVTAFLLIKTRNAELSLRLANETLEDRVARRTDELDRANAALRESEERIRLAAESAQIGCWTRYVTEDRVSWTGNLEAIFGLEPGSFPGTMEAFLGQVHPDDRDGIMRGHRRLLEDGISYTAEYRIFWPDGGLRHVESRASYIERDRGSEPVIVGMLMDITERKRLETELLRKGRLATLGQLTGTVAHELRNPLGAVGTSLGVIRRKCAAADLGLEKALDRAERGIARCDNIITELLDFARAKGLQAKPMELDSWLKSVIEDQNAGREIEVEMNLETGNAAVRFDPDQLAGAVINVFENARDAMRPDGAGIRAGDHARLSVATRLVGERVEIEFADSGPGIPNESLSDVLEPLYSTKSFGTGLGLPIVKRVMEEHGGGIDIQNRESGGARVLLWLPRMAEGLAR